MQSPDVVPAGWDQASAGYETVVMPNTQRYASEVLDAVGLKRGDRVLDVAAGTGAFSFLAARRGATVLATDFSPAMIGRLQARAARERPGALEARIMDGQKLELAPETFDAAVSVFGLIFFPDRAAGLREMHRVLRPGGRVGLATWSNPQKVPVVSVMSEAVRTALPDQPTSAGRPPIFSMDDPEIVKQELAAAGFTNSRVRSVTYPWELPSAEAVWKDLAPASPVFASMLATLSTEKRERVHAALVRRLESEFGSGPVRLFGEAHIAVAHR
jgi:SAM-dependent methyltransferase